MNKIKIVFIVCILGLSLSFQKIFAKTIESELTYENNLGFRGKFKTIFSNKKFYVEGIEMDPVAVVAGTYHLKSVFSLKQTLDLKTCYSGSYKHTIFKDKKTKTEIGCMEDIRFNQLVTSYLYLKNEYTMFRNKVYCALLLFFIPWFVYSEDEIDFKNLVSDVETIQGQLNEVLNQKNTTCSVDFSKGEENFCEFKNLCKAYQKNVNSPYIYKNKSGQKIPNYHFYFALQELDNCVLMNKKPDEIIRIEAAKIRINTEKKFFAKLKEHNEEQIWLDYQIYFQEIALEQGRNTGFVGVGLPWGTEQIVSMAEETTGKVFLPETRAAFVKMIEYEKADFQKIIYLEKIDVLPEKLSKAFQNPFLDSKLAVDKKNKNLDKHREKFQVADKRARDLFKSVLNEMIDFLRSKMNDSNKMAVENLISRLNTVRYHSDEPLMNRHCNIEPNAFYSPSTHSFTLCASLLEMPDTSLKTIIAHELGHAIDPCTSTGPLHKLTGESVLTKENKELLFEQDTKPLILNDTFKTLYVTDTLEDSASIKEAENEYKFITKKSEIEVERIPREQFPFNSVIDCLRSKDSISARGTDLAVIYKLVEDQIKALETTGATEENSTQLKQVKQNFRNIDNYVNSKSACSFLGAVTRQNHSQIQEAFSDWISAEVMGRQIARLPLDERKEQSFEVSAFFSSMHCSVNEAPMLKNITSLLKKYKCTNEMEDNVLYTLYKTRTRESDSHSVSLDRIERLFYTQPELRAALGCKSESPAKHCQ